MKATLNELHAQWQANRRLRIAVGLALVVAAAHLSFSAGDARRAVIAQYQSDAGLLARLEGAAADDTWPARADEAATTLKAVEARFTRVAGPGEAQAELQARLSGMATAAGFPDARVRTESAAPVEGLPEVLEVTARLDASGTVAAVDALFRALAEPGAILVERAEVRDGDTAQVQFIVRGYFLLGAAGASPEVPSAPAPEVGP